MSWSYAWKPLPVPARLELFCFFDLMGKIPSDRTQVWHIIITFTPLENWHDSWKLMVGRCNFSFYIGPFSGDMLIFGGVPYFFEAKCKWMYYTWVLWAWAVCVCECHNQVILQISFEPFLFSSRDSGLGWNFICWIQWLHVMSKLDLLKWFFTFCHGKSPLNHHLGEYLFFSNQVFFNSQVNEYRKYWFHPGHFDHQHIEDKLISFPQNVEPHHN